jgi:hypothetical protein
MAMMDAPYSLETIVLDGTFGLMKHDVEVLSIVGKNRFGKGECEEESMGLRTPITHSWRNCCPFSPSRLTTLPSVFLSSGLPLAFMLYSPYYDPPATKEEHHFEKSATLQLFFTVTAKMFNSFAAENWHTTGKPGPPPLFEPTVGEVRCDFLVMLAIAVVCTLCPPSSVLPPPSSLLSCPSLLSYPSLLLPPSSHTPPSSVLPPLMRLFPLPPSSFPPSSFPLFTSRVGCAESGLR